MKYGKINGLEKEVSAIFYGLGTQPFLNGYGEELISAARACGINAFDLARVYGKSEEVFGKWLDKNGTREEVVILSKCSHPSLLRKDRLNGKEAEKDLALSLEKLNTDYIDIYLFHRDSPKKDVSCAVEIMNEFKAKGKIKVFGASNWSYRRIDEANEYAYKKGLVPFSVTSPQFSLVERVNDVWGNCVTLSGKENEADRIKCAKSGIAVLPYSPLGHGFMSGKIVSSAPDRSALPRAAVKGFWSEENLKRLARAEAVAERTGYTVSQIALAWLFCRGMNIFPIISASAPERIEKNAAAADIKLTEEDVAFLSGE
ncbi:MAG: aldo/keto reductase [Clostridia bacterium]|nr:aldo/keto reductase [Clostridia bacterium]